VKLLLDENLSRKLVSAWLSYIPVMIVTTDYDFHDFAAMFGPPPKVVWLRRWRHPTKDAEQVLRREAVRITEFAMDPEPGVLVLDRN
jgi:predicted nuclease of predicted toxin-antitoxin system